MEALGRHGHSTDASDGGVQGMAVQQVALDKMRPWQHTWARSADENDHTSGLTTFMNVHTVQEQALMVDSVTRADMIIVPRQGESVSVLELMDVSRK